MAILKPKEPLIRMPLRVPASLKAQLEAIASETNYSLNEVGTEFLQAGVAEYRSEDPAAFLREKITEYLREADSAAQTGKKQLGRGPKRHD